MTFYEEIEAEQRTQSRDSLKGMLGCIGLIAVSGLFMLGLFVWGIVALVS